MTTINRYENLFSQMQFGDCFLDKASTSDANLSFFADELQIATEVEELGSFVDSSSDSNCYDHYVLNKYLLSGSDDVEDNINSDYSTDVTSSATLEQPPHLNYESMFKGIKSLDLEQPSNEFFAEDLANINHSFTTDEQSLEQYVGQHNEQSFEQSLEQQSVNIGAIRSTSSINHTVSMPTPPAQHEADELFMENPVAVSTPGQSSHRATFLRVNTLNPLSLQNLPPTPPRNDQLIADLQQVSDDIHYFSASQGIDQEPSTASTISTENWQSSDLSSGIQSDMGEFETHPEMPQYTTSIANAVTMDSSRQPSEQSVMKSVQQPLMRFQPYNRRPSSISLRTSSQMYNSNDIRRASAPGTLQRTSKPNIICWKTGQQQPNPVQKPQQAHTALSDIYAIQKTNPGERRIGKWMPWEDELLRKAVQSVPTISWWVIAQSVPGRSEKQCRSRWRVLNRTTFYCGRWTTEEDEALVNLVQTFLHMNPDRSRDDIPWSYIAANLPHPRTSQQASARYSERLDPRVSVGAWTQTDDAALLEAVEHCGRNWSEVSRYLGHRRGQRQCRQRLLRLTDPKHIASTQAQQMQQSQVRRSSSQASMMVC